LFEDLVALLTTKFVRWHVFPSCSSAFDLDAINDLLDPEHVPGIAFGHLFHGLVGNQPIERDDPVLGCNPDFGRIDKWIFFQCEPDSISQLIVIVLFRRHFFQAVNDIASSRHPPSQDACAPFVLSTEYFPVEGD